jgi:hypothetical protein
MLTYPVHTGGSLMPSLTVGMGNKGAGLAIVWACAGIYSLLLYVLIILLYFKRTKTSGFRNLLYFVIGLFGTFFVVGMIFHNTYRELFGFTWICSFIVLIVCIERFTLVEKARDGFKKISSRLERKKDKLPPIPVAERVISEVAL